MNTQIQKAIEVFKNGGIVIFPTDTAIGIGCRIDNEEAIKKIFKIRKRPENKPVLALVDSLEMAQGYLSPIPQKVIERLIKPYWPGKLTIILNCDVSKVPSAARSGGKTLGIRFPNKSLVLDLIGKVGVPIIAPSANLSGKKTPFKFADLDPEIVSQADYVLNEEAEPEENVSTVIDCAVESWKIIREGAVKISNL